MEYLVLGFFTGLSLILAIGAQNIFVIEQGLKKQHVFLVCLVCSLSDLLLIFSGILLFHFFHQYLNLFVELVLNISLIIFLIYFIYSKIKSLKINVNFNSEFKDISSSEILLKTLGFTYLNAHVYSDTVFFLGNFSKNFLFDEKIYFGVGASIASFIFFFLLGYLSVYFSKYAQKDKTWKYINIFIIGFMFLLTIYIVKETVHFL
ncbi:LysE family transporter [Pelagibacterales bacterium SAG-MED13]|nr:LysE family transporter [Pelagibacterales bacterium SAG-MED13]